MKKYLIISTLVMGMGIFAADTKPLTIQEIERLPFDDAFQQWLQSPEIQNPDNPLLMYSMAISDAKTGKFTPTPFWALTCHLGQDAHLHESFLISALHTNENVSLILDSSPVLCSRYGVNSESVVKFDPKDGYTFVMRDSIVGPDGRRSTWLDAIKKTNSQTNGAVNQSQPIQPETSGPSSVADKRETP